MDRKLTLAALLAMALAIASPALAVDKASAVLKDKDGKEVGKVELTDTPSGVLMRLSLDGVPPGDHAFHVHASANASRLISSPPVPISILTRPSTG